MKAQPFSALFTSFHSTQLKITAYFQINDEIKITHEDQKMINAFANKNTKHNELKVVVQNKKVKLR